MNNAWLHRFAVLTAVATLALVGVGGLVTSHGAGLAVPDWPNTYGYNMFFFPISQWVGGVFYEHTHRLVASGVGLLTMALALWLYGKTARPLMRWGGLMLLISGAASSIAMPRHWTDGVVLGAAGLALFGASWICPRGEPAPKWLRRMGLAAFLAVLLQGVLGGLRVVWLKDYIGIFHAALAQLFFVLTCAIALFTSRWWNSSERRNGGQTPGLPFRKSDSKAAGWLFILATLLIFGQLLLGATMRHQHAGLAIPDFPLAYGRLWPPTDPASVAHYNQQRMEVAAANPITTFQIRLQMVHRLVAVLILAAVAACAWLTRRGLAFAWLGLILAQALLGMATIWSNKAADIATAHVVVGALSLALGASLSIVCCRGWPFPHTLETPRVAGEALPRTPFGARRAAVTGLE
jgi:cytochrome c oxidase assembly protein subunit 15